VELVATDRVSRRFAEHDVLHAGIADPEVAGVFAGARRQAPPEWLAGASQFGAQSSPHRTKAIQALCTELNALGTKFPGTGLRLNLAIRPPNRSRSDTRMSGVLNFRKSSKFLRVTFFKPISNFQVLLVAFRNPQQPSLLVFSLVPLCRPSSHRK
jgi:hypothetical protein